MILIQMNQITTTTTKMWKNTNFVKAIDAWKLFIYYIQRTASGATYSCFKELEKTIFKDRHHAYEQTSILGCFKK